MGIVRDIGYQAIDVKSSETLADHSPPSPLRASASCLPGSFQIADTSSVLTLTVDPHQRLNSSSPRIQASLPLAAGCLAGRLLGHNRGESQSGNQPSVTEH